LTIYRKFEDLPAWQVVDTAIADLIENGELELTTHHLLAIGYATKALRKRMYCPLDGHWRSRVDE
jgi:hypothetical protein